MLPYLSFLMTSDRPWNFSRSSWAEILRKGVRQWTFISMCFPCGPRFLFLFSLWQILQPTRCCGSLPICFFYLSDHTVYVKLCCFYVPIICYTLVLFLFSNAYTQMPFCRDWPLPLVGSAWLRVCCSGRWQSYICARFCIFFVQYYSERAQYI